MFFKSKKKRNDYPMNDVYNGPAIMGGDDPRMAGVYAGPATMGGYEPEMACVYAGPPIMDNEAYDEIDIFHREDEPAMALAYDVPIVDVPTYPNSKEEPPVQLIYGCPEVLGRGIPAYSPERVCDECGKGLEPDFEFCPYCGKKLVDNV